MFHTALASHIVRMADPLTHSLTRSRYLYINIHTENIQIEHKVKADVCMDLCITRQTKTSETETKRKKKREMKCV